MDAGVNVGAYLKTLLSAAALWALPVAAALAQFDHRHAAWTALLAKYVVVTDGGKASRMSYAGIARERQALKSYLDSLARVTEAEFRKWNRDEQLAFLINAYNAHMVELVLTRYPNIASVWDFGKLLNHPFRSRFFRLFGREVSLDMIEHDTLRAKGVYDEPRIHMAVNCASIGCPMLREEAYVADRLDAQLEEQVVRFLSDRNRNRYNSAMAALEVSQIFRWYRDDFEAGHGGIASREQFFAKYAALLADTAASEQAIRSRKVPIRHLEYDWRLNDVKAP
jgi:hypothetical protein